MADDDENSVIKPLRKRGGAQQEEKPRNFNLSLAIPGMQAIMPGLELADKMLEAITELNENIEAQQEAIDGQNKIFEEQNKLLQEQNKLLVMQIKIATAPTLPTYDGEGKIISAKKDVKETNLETQENL